MPESWNYPKACVVLHAEDNKMFRNSKPHQASRFERIWARYLRVFEKLGLSTLALSALATAGKAQNAYQGKFTLAVEAHWEGVTLPAGDYTFALPYDNAPYRLYIWGQGVGAIITDATADQRVISERSQLNPVDTAVGYTVQTFEAPELGVTFSYLTPTQKKSGHKEVRQETVPRTVPASQVSESKTSIEVETARRQGKSHASPRDIYS
jgi:hypothetical protein